MRFKIALFIAVVASVVLHELGHALSALAFGDDTAKQAGHITLNPWKVSPFGAVVLPGLLILAGGFPIAFAATPVSPRKMRNPRLHSMLCSLAGPAVNIVLIGVSIAVLRAASPQDLAAPGFGSFTLAGLVEHWPTVYLLAYAFGYINVILAVFNLIPVPPLDGSAVIERLLPRNLWPGWMKFRQWGMGILIFVALATPLFSTILRPFLNLWSRSWAHFAMF
jgi:Zn-dependent protease